MVGSSPGVCLCRGFSLNTVHVYKGMETVDCEQALFRGLATLRAEPLFTPPRRRKRETKGSACRVGSRARAAGCS